MAKKTKELSLEEKLEQALVPVDEQPYEVPKNWNQIYLKSVVSLGDGEKIAGEEHKYLEVKYLRGNKEPDIKDSGKYVENSGGIQVINQTGTLLPETGGTGRTILYAAGSIFTVVAIVVIVTKKRMKHEE